MTTPHDLAAEAGLIGSAMLRGELLDDAGVTGTDFHDPTNALVYDAMLSVWREKGTLDVALAALRAERSGVERATFASFAEVCRTPVHGLQFAAVVAEMSRRRSLVRMADRLRGDIEAGSDASDAAEAALRDMAALVGEGGGELVKDAAPAVEGVLESLRSGEGRKHGLMTGYPALDYKTLGMRPGELWVVAGRPSMGKSAFAYNIMWNLAQDGKRSVLFTLEVDEHQVARNLVSIASGIGIQKVISGSAVDKATYEAACGRVAPLLDSLVWVCDDPRVTVEKIRARARWAKRRQGLDLIVVDYIQLCEGSGKRSRNEDVGEITRGLKLLARELGVPVMALSQLNRGVESRTDKRPFMSDLKDSGSIEQDADLVALLYRPWYYTRIPSEERDVEVNIGKQRNGPTGVVRMDFEATCLRFSVPRMG